MPPCQAAHTRSKRASEANPSPVCSSGVPHVGSWSSCLRPSQYHPSRQSLLPAFEIYSTCMRSRGQREQRLPRCKPQRFPSDPTPSGKRGAWAQERSGVVATAVVAVAASARQRHVDGGGAPQKLHDSGAYLESSPRILGFMYMPPRDYNYMEYTYNNRDNLNYYDELQGRKPDCMQQKRQDQCPEGRANAPIWDHTYRSNKSKTGKAKK